MSDNHQGSSEDMEQGEIGSLPNEESTLDWETKAKLHLHAQCCIRRYSDWDRYRSQLPSLCMLLLRGLCVCFEKGDCMCTSSAEICALKRNIGFPLFGMPPELAHVQNEFTGYNKEQLKCINNIFKKIETNQNRKEEILVSLVYVLVEVTCISNEGAENSDIIHLSENSQSKSMKDASSTKSSSEKEVKRNICFPVFRIPQPRSSKDKEMFWFIDQEGRIYKSWESYLKNNVLPPGKFCYPTNGFNEFNSTGELCVGYGKTPARKLGSKLLNYADTTCSFLGVGLMIGGEVAPVVLAGTAAAAAAPVCLVGVVATGLYGVVRSAYAQADRGIHGQSVSVCNREALKNWLGIAGSAFSLGSMGAVQYLTNLARQGKVLSKTVKYVTNGLRGSSIVLNGVSIAEDVYTLHEKRHNKELTRLDCFQVSAQILFLFGSLWSFKSSSDLFQAEQLKYIEEHKGSLRSNRHRKMFEGVKRQTMKNEEPMKGRAKVINGINHTSDADKVYASLIRSKKALFKEGSKVAFDESGKLHCNKSNFNMKDVFKECHFDKSKFNPSPSSMNSLQSYHKAQEYYSKIVSYVRDCLKSLSQYVPNKVILMNILQEFFKHIPVGEYIMEVLTIVFDVKQCNTIEDYVKVAKQFVEFCSKFYDLEFDEYFKRFFFEKDEEDTDHDDSDSKAATHIENVFKECRIPLFLMGMEDYQTLEEELYHFPDHLTWNDGIFTEEEYLTIGKNVLGISNVNNANIGQNGPFSKYINFGCYGVVFVTSKPKERYVIIQKASPHNDVDCMY